jgi:hypothetical protein
MLLVVMCCLLAAWTTAPCCAAELAIKDGQKIAFMGDQVTRWEAFGYAQDVIQGLAANSVKAELILVANAGTTAKMLDHLDENVLAKKPDWLVINGGVDNAWANCTVDAYARDLAQIIDKAQASGIKVLLSTATMVGEDPGNSAYQLVAAYNVRLCQLAQDKQCLLANFDMPAAVAAAGGGAQSPRGNVLLVSDYIFLNPLGHQLLALAILKAVGLEPAQIDKARASWLDRTDLCEAKASLTVRQYQRLDAMAAKQNRPTPELLGELVSRALAAEARKSSIPSNHTP